jgi:hypothetical protein
MPFTTPWYANTLSIAMRFHAGQTDKAGRPYWTHLDRVARNVAERWPDATKTEIHAALLHDVIEDTNATPNSLRALRVPDDVIRIVQMLSRDDVTHFPKGLTYLEWIQAIADSGDVSAIRVKLADNADNDDPARLHPRHAEMSATKYAPARAILRAALAWYPAYCSGSRSNGAGLLTFDGSLWRPLPSRRRMAHGFHEYFRPGLDARMGAAAHRHRAICERERLCSRPDSP